MLYSISLLNIERDSAVAIQKLMALFVHSVRRRMCWAAERSCGIQTEILLNSRSVHRRLQMIKYHCFSYVTHYREKADGSMVDRL
jgi:hypothetical protein